MSNKRQYFRVEECRACDNSNRPAWRIVSIATLADENPGKRIGEIMATGIPTKEYAEACRQAMEKELSK